MNNIIEISKCPDCGSAINHKTNKCRCGWKNKLDQSTSFACCVIENNVRCNSTFEPRRINPGIDPSLFWCFNHAEKLRKKSDIASEIDKRSKIYSDSAKSQLMSNQEFCKELLEGMGCKFPERKKTEEEQVKHVHSILQKQNPLLAMNVEGVKN
jgi:hypothetical protein